MVPTSHANALNAEYATPALFTVSMLTIFFAGLVPKQTGMDNTL